MVSVLDSREIKKEIEKGIYYPEVVDSDKINISCGTKIILTELKKTIKPSDVSSLRKKIARRFGIIGEQNQFQVIINKDAISIKDRDYFDKIQFLWTIGENAEKYKTICQNLKNSFNFDGVVGTKSDNFHKTDDASMQNDLKTNITKTETCDDINDKPKEIRISGWIGAVENAGFIKGDNKITLLSWGKLVQEDILEVFNEAGLYSKYLIGEINADFLDEDEYPDIITSNRQSIIEDDGRYVSLKQYILGVLKDIQNKWTELRKEYSTEKSLKNPAVNQWFSGLSSSSKEYAKKLFEKIQSFPLDNDEDRKELYKYGILAFERLKLKENLEELNKIESLDDLKFSSVFQDIDGIESVLYYEIASERLKIINEFKKKVDDNELEKVIQKYIFGHLWLLHPSWERPTENVFLEESVLKEFGIIDNDLSDEEKKGRIDIRYKTAAGKHIIIELKRSDIRINIIELVKQIKKYKDALTKCLKSIQKETEPIEIICLLGKQPSEYDTDPQFVSKQLETVNARIILYGSLINDSIESYSEYLNSQKKATELKDIIDNI